MEETFGLVEYVEWIVEIGSCVYMCIYGGYTIYSVTLEIQNGFLHCRMSERSIVAMPYVMCLFVIDYKMVMLVSL